MDVNVIGSKIKSSLNDLNETKVSLELAQHLFAAITKFVELDLVFKSRPIYITRQSYAGKYIPAIGYFILKRNAELSNSV